MRKTTMPGTLNYALKDGQVFEVGLSGTELVEVLKQVSKSIDSRRKLFIVTPNPEIVSLANADPDYKRILNTSDLAVVDGIGLIAAEHFLAFPSPKNKLLRLPVILIQGLIIGSSILVAKDWLTHRLELIRGRDLFLEIIKLANSRGLKVFLYGGGRGSPAKAAKKLLQKYTNLKIKYKDAPMLNSKGKPISTKDSLIYLDNLRDIREFEPNILLVGITPPKQEYWISENMQKLRKTTIFVAVGGSFDYYAEKVPLPPKWISANGFEWLWRLFTQPKRARRILTATILFPLRIFWYKLMQ